MSDILIIIKTDKTTGKVNEVVIKNGNSSKVYKNKKALKIAQISVQNEELLNRWIKRFF